MSTQEDSAGHKEWHCGRAVDTGHSTYWDCWCLVATKQCTEPVGRACNVWYRALKHGGVLAQVDQLSHSSKPCWLILDNRILSYQQSQDDIFKISIKMTVYEIKAPSTDNTRMKLIIPRKWHFYMRGVNATMKQGVWLPLGALKYV